MKNLKWYIGSLIFWWKYKTGRAVEGVDFWDAKEEAKE